MPCYRCGVRQTDPSRGESPWRRGVLSEHLVLVCPACQQSSDWTAELDHCARCGGAHLIRRLDQVECLDCGLVREPAPPGPPGAAAPADAASPAGAASSVQAPPAPEAEPTAALAEEVSRALDRVLGRR